MREDKLRWDRMLPFLEFEYGHGVNESTKETPHYLEYGRDLRCPPRYNVRIPTRGVTEDMRDYLK